MIESTERHAGPARLWPDRLLPRLLDDRLVLPGLYLLGLAARLWDLGRRSLWFDEFTGLSMSALEFDQLRFAMTVEPNMSAYYWLQFLWIRLIGYGASEGLVRLLPVVLGSATVPLIYLLGCRLHSRAVGLAAAGLLAVNPFHLLMSQEARSYALLSSSTVLSYLLLDRALELGRRRDWVWYGLATTLACYSHFYTIFTLLAQGLFVLSRRSSRSARGLLLAGLVMLLLLVQLAPTLLRKAGGGNLSHLQRPDLKDALNFLERFSGGSEYTLGAYAGLILIGLLISGAARRGRAYRHWLLSTWFILPTVLAFAISMVKPIFNDRYLFAAQPAMILSAAVGLARLPRLAAGAAFFAVTALSLLVLRDDFEVRRIEEWRVAVAYTSARTLPGDGYIFVSKWGQDGFEYYADWHWGRNPAAPYQDIFEPFDWHAAAQVAKYRGVLSLAGLEDFAARHTRIWLILSHEYDSVYGGDTAAPVRDWLTRHGYGATQRQFRGVRVILYQRRA